MSPIQNVATWTVLVLSLAVVTIGYSVSSRSLEASRASLYRACISLRDAKMNAYISSRNPDAVLDQTMPEACTKEFPHQF